tara:strand:- start:48 stop:242 length:195 start_codon:yes stop_codon:yes gene_type:complete
MQNTDNHAQRLGYTQTAHITDGIIELYLLVKPDVDLDSRFKAYDTDNQEWLTVNGWLFIDLSFI